MALLDPLIKFEQTTIPRFFYGTAWKEEKTETLTFEALSNGFRAIDTANQRKHYFEEGVGAGIKRYLAHGKIRREDLFLQTKFTFARGQDHRKPYIETDPFTKQVADSFQSSIQHLQTNYIDSYVLHGPYSATGIFEEDLETWQAMEKLVENKQVKFLGVSNVTYSQLMELCQKVRIKPTFVQNRCYARLGWDKRVREVCKTEGLIYQGFSILTANQNELSLPLIKEISKKHNKSIAQIIFRFCQQQGMICLTGTSNATHMIEDLNIYDFELSPADLKQIENIAY